jgi:hypothetical protein
MNKQKAKPGETLPKSKPREAIEGGIAKGVNGLVMLERDVAFVPE